MSNHLNQPAHHFIPHCQNQFHINPLKAKLNPIHHLLALVGARHIVHISRVRVNVPIYLCKPKAWHFPCCTSGTCLSTHSTKSHTMQRESQELLNCRCQLNIHSSNLHSITQPMCNVTLGHQSIMHHRAIILGSNASYIRAEWPDLHMNIYFNCNQVFEVYLSARQIKYMAEGKLKCGTPCWRRPSVIPSGAINSNGLNCSMPI
jgi:hypothetical protein